MQRYTIETYLSDVLFVLCFSEKENHQGQGGVVPLTLRIIDMLLRYLFGFTEIMQLLKNTIAIGLILKNNSFF